MKKWLLIVLFLIVLLAGCATFSGGVNKTVENYYPLSVGNSWTYQNSWDGETSTTEVVDSYEWDGQTVYECSSDRFNFYIVEVEKELRLYFRDKPKENASYLVMLKEPLKVGQKWYSPPPFEDTLYIVSTDISVSVPAGEFKNCIEVRSKSEDRGIIYLCFAPGVGQLKLEFGERGTRELIDYHRE